MSVADRIALGLPLIERIKEVIGERKIKQARLARECGIEKSLVSKTLRGVVRLRQPDALSMVLALNRMCGETVISGEELERFGFKQVAELRAGNAGSGNAEFGECVV